MSAAGDHGTANAATIVARPKTRATVRVTRKA